MDRREFLYMTREGLDAWLYDIEDRERDGDQEGAANKYRLLCKGAFAVGRRVSVQRFAWGDGCSLPATHVLWNEKYSPRYNRIIMPWMHVVFRDKDPDNIDPKNFWFNAPMRDEWDDDEEFVEPLDIVEDIVKSDEDEDECEDNPPDDNEWSEEKDIRAVLLGVTKGCAEKPSIPKKPRIQQIPSSINVLLGKGRRKGTPAEQKEAHAEEVKRWKARHKKKRLALKHNQ